MFIICLITSILFLLSDNIRMKTVLCHVLKTECPEARSSLVFGTAIMGATGAACQIITVFLCDTWKPVWALHVAAQKIDHNQLGLHRMPWWAGLPQLAAIFRRTVNTLWRRSCRHQHDSPVTHVDRQYVNHVAVQYKWAAVLRPTHNMGGNVASSASQQQKQQQR